MRATPKVDVRYVILAAILLISAFQYLSAHQKYAEALKYAKEQVKFRNMAIDIAKQRGVLEFDKLGKIKKKQKSGADAEEIISLIIEENINISGGYKKQTIYDTLAWKIISLPVILYRHAIFWAIWGKKYWLQKQEYDEDAKLFLIRRHLKINEDQFHALEEKVVADYMSKELWKKPEFDRWKEAKDLEEKDKLANSGRYRQYKRQMKKQEEISTKAMSHTILLIQSSSKVESRTWSDYETTLDCMEAICKIYEEHLKKLNPDVPCIQYDVSDLFKFIDRLADLSCLIVDNGGKVYVPKGKDFIKEQIFILLRGQAGSNDRR